MNIYKNDGTLRSDLHELADSEIVQEISAEEYATVKFVYSSYIPFDIGDYTTIFGVLYLLKDKPAPIDKTASTKYEYELKMYTTRIELDNVDFQLFDNTTSTLAPAYNALTSYSVGDVVVHKGFNWQCLTACTGISPYEGVYWQLIQEYMPPYSETTAYVKGDRVSYQSVYYEYVNAVSTIGETPEEGEYWTIVRTAPQWDFSITLSPKRYAQLIVDNMNRARPEQTWVVGYTIDADPLQTTFSNVSCLEAASTISELFETEFWVDNYTFNIGKLSTSTSLTLKHGTNEAFTKLTRKESTETKRVTRLIALGGEKNLLGTYRNGSKRLMLPDRYYIDSAEIDLKNPLVDVATWDDVYPYMAHATESYNAATTYQVEDMVTYDGLSWTCVAISVGNTPAEGAYWKLSEGTVTTDTSQYKFIDKNISFNPLSAEYLMTDGTVPKVKFITGNLAGYEFPITKFDNDTKEFTLEQISDDTDSYLPLAAYGFDYGDQYVLVDLYMPSTYIIKAQNRLLAKAIEYLSKYSGAQVTYECEVNQVWATKNTISFNKGDVVRVVDTAMGIDLDYRITKVTKNVTQPYKYTIEFSNLPYVPSKITSIANATSQNDTYISSNGLKDPNTKVQVETSNGDAIPLPSGTWLGNKSYVGGKLFYSLVQHDDIYYKAKRTAGIFSSTLTPDVDDAHWTLLGTGLQFVATNLLLAQVAYIENLIVSQLATSSNPYASRFANVGTGVGVFKNLEDQGSIDNALVAIGKDVSIMQQAGERKPALVVRDNQWRGTYSATTIYDKDDRVYYSTNAGATAYSSSTAYSVGSYVTYNSTVWRCILANTGNTPGIGSSYWTQDGNTYLFYHQWLETETPIANITPTNSVYWSVLGSGNLGGGKYSELGSEGLFANGSNIQGFSAASGITTNCSLVSLLQKRNSQADGISTAVLGIDQTGSSDGSSKSYGGYFNRLRVDGLYKNIRVVTTSQTLLKTDCTIHCYATESITLTLPTPDNAMVGMEITVRKLGATGWCYIDSHVANKIWKISALTTVGLGDDDTFSFTWDGNYWVTSYNNN